MDYSLTLCFEGFNAKRIKFQQERKEKKQLQQSMSRQNSVYRDKRQSKWLRKSVTTIFLLSQHEGLTIEKERCHDKRQCVATEHGKNVTSQLRQREIMLRQGLSAGCQHQEEIVTTLKTGKVQKLCCDKVSYVATRN